MKFKNLTDKEFLLHGVFKDPTRGLKLAASGEAEFPNNRVADGVADKLKPLAEKIKVEQSVVADMTDDDFKSKTVDSSVKSPNEEYEAWISIGKDGYKTSDKKREPYSPKGHNGQGIEDVVAFVLVPAKP